MNQKTKALAQGALIAAMYAALTHLQNILLPGSATWAIQLRLSEALCVLAFFTKAAIPGLGIGCMVFDLTYAGALPLDAVIGTMATLIACGGMYFLRGVTLNGIPIAGLCLPVLSNALLVGWELTVYIGESFWVNALYVALGEAAVMATAGCLLYTTVKKRGLDRRLFGGSTC